MAASKLITCVCLGCSVTFTVYGSHKYCSQDCYHKARTTPLAERLWAYVLKTETCWLWQGGLMDTGYGRIVIDNKPRRAHRIAYELTYGMILPGIRCCHTCDNRACVRPDHLFLGTDGDNLRDMSRKGRSGAHVHPDTLARGDRNGAHTHPEKVRRGTQCYQAKLTEAQVRQIRHLRATEQWTHRRLAAFFGVSRPVIGKILNGKNWKSVD